MFPAKKVLTLVILAVLQLLSVQISFSNTSGEKVIFVWESTYTCDKLQYPDVICTTIEGALKILQSQENTSVPTDVVIHVGHHQIRETAVISNVKGIRLIGDSGNRHMAKSVISCAKDVGLVFVKVKDLQLENITILNCGASNVIRSAKLKIGEEIDFLQIPQSDFKVALFMVLCRNVTLQHTTITNTSGIGLLGINVMESLRLISSTFYNNNGTGKCRSLSHTELDCYKGIGGGAYFLYLDQQSEYCVPHTHLSIYRSSFFSNMDCSFTGVIIDFLPTLKNRNYVGAGGGLSIMLAQRSFSVDVSVQESEFRENKGRLGGGAHIGLFSGVSNSHINISDCTFVGNGMKAVEHGKEEVDHMRHARVGAGLMVVTDLLKPKDFDITNYTKLLSNTNTSLRIKNSNFTNNFAHSGGGIFIYSLYTTSKITPQKDVLNVSISDCNFSHNSATVGGAILVYQKKFIGRSGGMGFEMSNIVVAENTIIFYDSKHVDSVRYNSAAVDLRYIRAKLSDNTKFLHNAGSALRISGSVVRMTGNVIFANNAGVLGGAIQLYFFGIIVVGPKSDIAFRNNTATVKGGAIYTHIRSDNIHSVDAVCSLYFKDLNAPACLPKQTCPNITDLGIHIHFSGNKAPLGSIIFGSTLETCPWAVNLKPSESPLTFLSQSGVIDLGSDLPNGSSQVSTPPAVLNIINKADTYKFMPGETFLVMIEALDTFHQCVPAAITSTIVDVDESVSQLNAHDRRVKLGQSGYWYLNGEDGSTPVVVYGNENDRVSVVIYAVDSFAGVNLTVHLQPCDGVLHQNSTSLSCECSKSLKEFNITCMSTENGYRLSIPNRIWIGNSDIDDGIMVGKCINDYCKSGNKQVNFSNYDSQCAMGYNRKGLLCSTCEDGYSIVFGSNRCKKCSNKFISLILAFGAAGILLILLISIFNITLSEGYLNGVLFYCHVVNVFATVLFPNARFSSVTIPMALLSLNLGFEVCFYNGMTSLIRVFLQLVFPVYLFILMGIIVLLARKSPYLNRIGFSAAKTFGTLLVVCYTCVLETCIEAFSFKYLDTLDNRTFSRWNIDAYVHYFQKWHGFLFFLSMVLIVIYLAPLPLVLLFPSNAYQFKYSRRLKPIYDSLWAPFKPKFRFWLGFRLALRIIPFTFVHVTVYYPMIFFILCIFLIGLLAMQLSIRPFRGTVRNLVDSSLIINMAFLFAGVLFFSNTSYTVGSEKRALDQTYFSMALVLLAYLQFFGVFIYHLQLRFSRFREFLLTIYLKIKAFHLLGCFNRYDETGTAGTHLHDDNERAEIDGNDSYYFDIDGDSADRDPELPARLYQARRSDDRALRTVQQSVLSAPLLEEGSLQLASAL